MSPFVVIPWPPVVKESFAEFHIVASESAYTMGPEGVALEPTAAHLVPFQAMPAMLLKDAMEALLVHCIPSKLFHIFPVWFVPANQYEPDHFTLFITSVFKPVPLAFDHPDNRLVVYFIGLPVIAPPTATHIEPLYAISFAFKLIGLDTYEDTLELVYIVLFVTKI
jgi:hypothetical protein